MPFDLSSDARSWLRVASVLGAAAVGTGAFGAHALKSRHVDPALLKTWETAVQYQFYHAGAIGLAAVALDRNAGTACGLFTAGTVLFSGSLYALTLTKHRKLGIITPFGGLCFIAGWLAMAGSV